MTWKDWMHATDLGPVEEGDNPCWRVPYLTLVGLLLGQVCDRQVDCIQIDV